MKKKNIINLIKYHVDNNEAGFRTEAYEIANEFEMSGDYQLAEYIMALLSNINTFVPQMNDGEFTFFEHLEKSNETFILPDCISEDLLGIINATQSFSGINKFLFQGRPGTGKTEAVKHLARALNREVYMVNFSAIIDSKLGETPKNISKLFDEINSLVSPEEVIILFDEIDALALDRTNENDLREMGRATSSLLKALDRVNDQIVIIATTNLIDYFDSALLRRFDTIIDFNRYERDDLIKISEEFLNKYLSKHKLANKDIRLFRKILSMYDEIPYPGDLKNIIKTSIAFSNPNDGNDYLRKLYYKISMKKTIDLLELYNNNFTLREMEILSKIPKSSIARIIKELLYHE